MNNDGKLSGSFSCPIPFTSSDTIQPGHGGGGRMSRDLISDLFVRVFDNTELSRGDDQATITIGDQKLAFTTDSYVVDPIFFPGGDIGELAVNGTVNDLCTSGAQPLFLSAGFVLEEGLPLEELSKIVESMKRAADRAGVSIVTGDTKVVNKGSADKLFINTAGIGILDHDYDISCRNVRAGDIIIISGTIADHGIAILSRREGLSFTGTIRSDTAPLHEISRLLMETAGGGLHAMRDPTRGGVAATLNELAQSSEVEFRIYEEHIPVHPAVTGACEMLGLDPLHVANEGKMVICVTPEKAEQVLAALKTHPLGKDAAIIGEVFDEKPGLVSMRTRIGGWRIIDLPAGELLPRIC